MRYDLEIFVCSHCLPHNRLVSHILESHSRAHILDMDGVLDQTLSGLVRCPVHVSFIDY